MPSADTPNPLDPGDMVILPSGRFATVVEIDRRRSEATVEYREAGQVETAAFRISRLTRLTGPMYPT